MKLSQSVTYAVHAALRLAEQNGDGPISCGRLAREGKMPERFLLQILRDLTKKGILQSTRGGGGGFTLRRPADEISLLELIEAVDGPIAAGLPTNLTFPDASDRMLRDTLDQITDSTRQQLDRLTLSQLTGPNGDGGNGHHSQSETISSEPIEATEPAIAEPTTVAALPKRPADHPRIPTPRHLSVVAGMPVEQ